MQRNDLGIWMELLVVHRLDYLPQQLDIFTRMDGVGTCGNDLDIAVRNCNRHRGLITPGIQSVTLCNPRASTVPCNYPYVDAGISLLLSTT